MANDDPKLWNDLDDDGMTSKDPDKITSRYTSLVLTEVADSHQTLEILVENKDGTFVKSPTIAEIEEGKTFRYRLIMRAVSNDSTDLVLYNKLPRPKDSFFDVIGGSKRQRGSQWSPLFQSVDLAPLKAKGIQPVVYYSYEVEPGPLFNASNILNTADWTTDAPKSDAEREKLVAIAVDLSQKNDDSPYILEQGSELVVDYEMLAPKGMQANYNQIAHNTFYYEKTAWDAKNGKRLAKIFTTESNDTMILYTAPSGNPVTPNPDPKDPVVPSPDPNNPVTPSPVPEYPGQTEPVDKLPKQPQAVIPVPTRSFNPVFISETPSPNEPKPSLVSTPAASRARYETPQKQAQQLPLLPRTGIDSTTPLSLALLGLALSLVALRFFILRKR